MKQNKKKHNIFWKESDQIHILGTYFIKIECVHQYADLMGCVRSAVLRLSMVLLRSSSSSFSKANRVFLCKIK